MVGIWVGIILLLDVAMDASALVQYITHFTEENFALLITMIFIKNAFGKFINVGKEFHILQAPQMIAFVLQPIIKEMTILA